MRVFVRFKGDNDFVGGVMRAFGDLLLCRVLKSPASLTEHEIAEWFNTIAFTLYEMVQHRGDTALANRERLAQYLRIDSSDVYIDKHADEKMKTHEQWGNYDSVMVDDSEYARERVYLI